MGWGKRIRKKISKGVKSVVRKTPQYKVVKGVKSFFKPEEESDDGLRGEAAKRLVDTKRQAGSGQINFVTEEYE